MHLCELLTEISGKTRLSSEELRLEHKCFVFTRGHPLASVYAPSENQASEVREDGRASSCWVLSTFFSTNHGLRESLSIVNLMHDGFCSFLRDVGVVAPNRSQLTRLTGQCGPSWVIEY